MLTRLQQSENYTFEYIPVMAGERKYSLTFPAPTARYGFWVNS